MDTASVANPTSRIERGIRLYRERGGEIEVTRGGTMKVPSCTGDAFYVVYEEYGFCSCVDSRRARRIGERCKHATAASIYAAKRRSDRRARRDDTLDAHAYCSERLR